jgi:hypothetical protein
MQVMTSNSAMQGLCGGDQFCAGLTGDFFKKADAAAILTIEDEAGGKPDFTTGFYDGFQTVLYAYIGR